MSSEKSGLIPRPNTTEYYDEFGKYYDQELKDAGITDKMEELIGEIFDLKPASTVDSVLDLGAGTGLTVTAIKKHADPKRVVAVEPSSGMRAVFHKKRSLTGVSVVEDTMEGYMPRCDETFDLITCMATLELLPDAPDAVADACQLLNPDGIFAATYVPRAEGQDREILNDDSATLIAKTMVEYRWRPEEIERAISGSGLAVIARADAVKVQEHDAETHTEERSYNFVIVQKTR